MPLLFQSVSYFPDSVLLLLLLAYIPALACIPTLIEKPLCFAVIPIISIFIVNCLSWVFIITNHYNSASIRVSILILLLIAVIRLLRKRTWQFQWSVYEKQLLRLNILLILPFIVINGLSAFGYNDALSSWHYWAMLFTQHQLPDHTLYPQGYSLLLATCHELLNSIQVQGPVKAFTVIFPFTILNVIAFYSPVQRYFKIYFCVAVALLVMYYDLFFEGYADPMASACMIAAVALTARYFLKQDTLSLWLSVTASVMALLTKQPTLVWALFTLPLITVMYAIRHKKWNTHLVAVTAVVFCVALGWILGPGYGFWQNHGPMAASLNGDRATWIGLAHNIVLGFVKYILQNPLILLLMIASFFWQKESIFHRCVFWGLIIPGSVLWFMLANYDSREGLHIVVTMALFTVASPRVFDFLALRLRKLFSTDISLVGMKKLTGVITVLSLLFCVGASAQMQMKARIFPLNGYKTNLYWYFNQRQEWIYRHILMNPAVRVDVTDSIGRALFYPYVKTHMLQSANRHALEKKIEQEKINYIAINGFLDLRQANYVRALAIDYPQWLTVVSAPQTFPNSHFTLYQVHSALRPIQ